MSVRFRPQVPVMARVSAFPAKTLFILICHFVPLLSRFFEMTSKKKAPAISQGINRCITFFSRPHYFQPPASKPVFANRQYLPFCTPRACVLGFELSHLIKFDYLSPRACVLGGCPRARSVCRNCYPSRVRTGGETCRCLQISGFRNFVTPP